MCYGKTNSWPYSHHGWCQSALPGSLGVSAADGSHLPMEATLWPQTNHWLTWEQGTKGCPGPGAQKLGLYCKSCFLAPQEHLECSFPPSCHPPHSISNPIHHLQENPLTSKEPDPRHWELSVHEVLEHFVDPGKRISSVKFPALP